MSRILAVIALLVALLSLALNVYLFTRLNQARSVVLDTLASTSTNLDALPDYTFKSTFKIDQQFPVSGTMPINQSLMFPISMTVPVKTTVSPNVNTPFGTMNFPVNIDTNFPVNMTVPVVISMTVPYSMTVPVKMDFPIEVKLRDLGVEDTVKSTQKQLDLLRSSLQ